MTAAIAFAIQALAMLPKIIEAGADAVRVIETTIAALRRMQEDGRDPSPEDWAKLNEMVAEAMQRLDTAARDPA